MITGSDEAVIDWLLLGDPAIRWQTMRDLMDEPAERVGAVRARVAREGWGARVLALQGADGLWEGGVLFPVRDGKPHWDETEGQPWTATAYSLELLYDLGADPSGPRVERAIERVHKNARWEHDDEPFFDGEVEPCINGMVVLLGTTFGIDVRSVVERLVDEQLADGGWNCEVERGSVRSSFHTTIRVLEGILAHERANGGSRVVTAARRRGEAYLLDRRLLRRRSTGEVIDPSFLLFSFPTRWFYDALRALEYFRKTGEVPDPRTAEALALVRSKRQTDGRWLLENTHPGAVPFLMDEGDGKPSRWNTLRAMRVLRWAGADR